MRRLSSQCVEGGQAESSKTLGLVSKVLTIKQCEMWQIINISQIFNDLPFVFSLLDLINQTNEPRRDGMYTLTGLF